MIILKAQHNRGPDEWTPELEQRFVETLDGAYNSLEKLGDREEDMGVFQLLDILEERMVGTAKERRERAELEERQAEIENHALFIKRSSSVDREKVGADYPTAHRGRRGYSQPSQQPQYRCGYTPCYRCERAEAEG